MDVVNVRKFKFWVRVAFFLVLCEVVYLTMPLSRPLPPYTGEYGVGALDVEVPVTPRDIGKAVNKDTGQPALKVCNNPSSLPNICACL